MSKNLVKIITICVLAVIIPVAIIVTAICLSNAVTYTLTLATAGFENAGNITLRVNGKEYDEAVKIERNKEVTVSVSTTGYTFAGWFVGEEKDITAQSEAAETEKTYTFKVTEDTTLTAVFNIIEYTITYDGVQADGVVKYGSTLNDGSLMVYTQDKSLANGDIFDGWTLAGSNKVYTKAEFDENTAIALTSKTKNLYEITGSLKNLTIKYDFDAEHWYDKNHELLTTIMNEIEYENEVENTELLYNYQTEKLIDGINDLELAEVYDSEGNAYTINYITLEKDKDGLNGKEFDVEGLDHTLAELIEIYNTEFETDLQDGGEILIRINYTVKAA